MDGKTVIVTGATNGIGEITALELARQGAKVVVVSRTQSKLENTVSKIKSETGNQDVSYIKGDLSSLAEIRQVADEFLQTHERLDVLLNNAGAGFAKTTEQATEEEIKWVTEVNYHGVVFCTQAVLPFMRSQKYGQIISITSVGGLVGQPFNELYCGAKFAVEGFMEGLATYVGDAFNIKITCVEPGGITTKFMASAIEKTAVEGQFATGEYLPIFERYMAGNQKRANESKEQVYQTGLEVAEVILNVAKNENPPLRIRTSKWAEDFCMLKTQADPDGSKLVGQIKESFL